MFGLLPHWFAQLVTQYLAVIFAKINHLAVGVRTEEIMLLRKGFVPGFANVVQNRFPSDFSIVFAIGGTSGVLVGGCVVVAGWHVDISYWHSRAI